MKIELNKNKVYLKNGSIKKEIHPFWLRERVDEEEFLDKGTQQRLFDPTTLNSEISINTAIIKEKFLEIDFNDGVNSKLDIEKLAQEFHNEDTVIKSIPKIKWDSNLENIKNQFKIKPYDKVLFWLPSRLDKARSTSSNIYLWMNVLKKFTSIGDAKFIDNNDIPLIIDSENADYNNFSYNTEFSNSSCLTSN